MRQFHQLLLTRSLLVKLIVVLALSSPTVNSSADIKYVVHTGPNGYPPFIFVDKQARGTHYSGIIIDLLNAFEQAHPEFSREYNAMTRTRANSRITRGEFTDLMFTSPDFVSLETKKTYLFTNSLFTSKDVVVTRKDSELEFLNARDLHGKSVATLRGYSYWEFDRLFLDDIVNAVAVDLHTQAIGMLERKRVDAYFGNIHVTPFYLKQIGLDIGKFKFSEAALSEVTYAFMTHRNNSELYAALNTFIKKSKADGSLQAIIDLYLK